METDDHPASIRNASQSVIPPENDPLLSVSKKARNAVMKEVATPRYSTKSSTP